MVDLRQLVLASRELRVVWTAADSAVVPAAIVEDVRTKRLYSWPDLRAWRKPLPGARCDQLPVIGDRKPREQRMLF